MKLAQTANLGLLADVVANYTPDYADEGVVDLVDLAIGWITLNLPPDADDYQTYETAAAPLLDRLPSGDQQNLLTRLRRYDRGLGFYDWTHLLAAFPGRE